MDQLAVDPESNVVVLAATNLIDAIDSVLLRPGRLELQLFVGPPDLSGRLAILQRTTRDMPLDSRGDLNQLAARTDGWTGAELTHVCQLAALIAIEEAGMKVQVFHIQGGLSINHQLETGRWGWSTTFRGRVRLAE